MLGERFEANQKNMRNMTVKAIEEQGKIAGRQYIINNYNKTLNIGITGADYLRGFLAGAEEQYNAMIAQENITTEQPKTIQ